MVASFTADSYLQQRLFTASNVHQKGATGCGGEHELPQVSLFTTQKRKFSKERQTDKGRMQYKAQNKYNKKNNIKKREAMSPISEEHIAEWVSFGPKLQGKPTREQHAAAKERKAKRAAMTKRLLEELRGIEVWPVKKIEKELDRLAEASLSAKGGRNNIETHVSPHTSEIVENSQPHKTVYLIRHGQSQGQASRKNGIRRDDKTLLDCNLTNRGISEAKHLPKLFTEEQLKSVELVISSPMTRALHTALLGFPSNDIIAHYDLRELGTKIPENIPREMKDVLRDLEPVWSERDFESVKFDVESMQPEDWPWRYSPNIKQKDLVREAFRWMYQEREENVIAVVCHYNVIRSAMVRGNSIRPENAVPIRCKLYSSGILFEA